MSCTLVKLTGVHQKKKKEKKKRGDLSGIKNWTAIEFDNGKVIMKISHQIVSR
jgi:hypothetical protein